MRHLLYCINRSYVEQMMVSLSSVLRHGQLGPLDVHIINRDLTQEDKMRISLLSSSSCHISFIHFDEDRLQGSPTSSRYPLEIYFRLFSPILLPDEVDRILYLDADVICINPLVELYDYDIEDKYIIACTHTKRTLTTINAIRLGLDFDSEAPYINTGVMLMNIASLRKDFNSTSILTLIEKRGGAFILPDQDIVMALYGERIALVDSLRYNLSDRIMLLANIARQPANRLSAQSVRKDSCLIHYCGRNKPWKKRYAGVLGCFYEEEKEALDRLLTEAGQLG